MMDRWKNKREQTPQLKIKKLEEGAALPSRGTPESAGLDLYSVSDITVRSGDIAEIHTGISMEIPSGYYGLLATRSSMGRRGVRIAAGCNIIDADYRGEVIVYLRNDGVYDWTIRKGDRVAQIIITPYLDVRVALADELTETDRRGGFGSTGR